MLWKIAFTSKAAKQARKLPRREQDILLRLIRDLSLGGPVQYKWQSYSRLGQNEHHCHLSYSWVACWRVTREQLELIEIYYAGSRENAPY